MYNYFQVERMHEEAQLLRDFSVYLSMDRIEPAQYKVPSVLKE